MRVASEQQDAAGRRKNEQDANQWFLDARPALFGPAQAHGGHQRGTRGDDLDLIALGIPLQRVGRNNAQPGDLCDRQVNEDDAALQHLLTQRHVRAQHQQARGECRPDNGPVDEVRHRPWPLSVER